GGETRREERRGRGVRRRGEGGGGEGRRRGRGGEKRGEGRGERRRGQEEEMEYERRVGRQSEAKGVMRQGPASVCVCVCVCVCVWMGSLDPESVRDRESTRLNS